VKKQGILEAMNRTLRCERELPAQSPYGDGKAAEKIVEIIKNELDF
jgi:UDP-N-acetylglucosamine 2-epimerase